MGAIMMNTFLVKPNYTFFLSRIFFSNVTEQFLQYKDRMR